MATRVRTATIVRTTDMGKSEERQGVGGKKPMLSVDQVIEELDRISSTVKTSAEEGVKEALEDMSPSERAKLREDLGSNLSDVIASLKQGLTEVTDVIGNLDKKYPFLKGKRRKQK